MADLTIVFMVVVAVGILVALLLAYLHGLSTHSAKFTFTPVRDRRATSKENEVSDRFYKKFYKKF